MVVEGVLPASGGSVMLRDPTGQDELLVLRGGHSTATVLALAEALATDPAGRPIDWLALPAVDLAAAALLIRGCWLGNAISADAMCPAPECGEPIDVAFDIPTYLEHHRPRRPRAVRADEDGWLTLRGMEVRFRIPTIADLLAALEGGGGQTLLALCVRPSDPTASDLRRIDRALELLAPRLDGELQGTCPGCGENVELRFEPGGYVLAELRDASAGLYTQVHELALAYHWSEEAILALDRDRRAAYMALIRGEVVFA